jgi:type II secretory pathway pseudopilin PulG
MLKLIRLTAKKRQTDQGFSMLEVLVASLIAFGFLMGSLQAMVLAVALKVQAQEKQIANQLIQKEIEEINRIAITAPFDSNSVETSKCIATSYANGYANALWDSYSTNATKTSSQKLLGDQGEVITLTSTKIDSNASNSPPYKTLKIQYQVNDSEGNEIATDYIEVIPNAALQCP